MSQVITSSFYQQVGIEDVWDFVGPNGAGFKNKGGHWNWGKTRTPSGNTGPFNGGYNGTPGFVYIETSAPSQNGDVFTMTLKDSFSLESSSAEVKYWYNSNTVDAPLIELLAWNGIQWEVIDSFNPDVLDDVWYERSASLFNFTNNDCVLRFRITTIGPGSSYRHDVALDNIEITITDDVLDDIATFYKNKNILKNQFNNSFDASQINNLSTILNDFKTALVNFDFANYPNGVVVIESEHKVHHFKEDDKWH